MMKRISLCVAALGLALTANSALANCNGRGCDNPTPSNPGNNTATGGQGGAGYGGNGYGLGVGIGKGGAGGAGGQGGEGGRGGAGGSVLGSGNSSNLNANTNQQAQGQAQGQMQGQGQAQSSRNANANRNDNRSSATGGNSAASNEGNNSAQTVNVEGSTYEASRMPVATAYAPNIAPTATCMGSSSAGGQGMTFGFSVGTSWTDENCMKLERVRTVATVIGDKEIAAEMMCDIPDYANARARAGRPCGSSVVATTQVEGVGTVYAVAQDVYVTPQQPKPAPVVSPVPPRVERYRVTLNGLQAQ